MSANENGVSDFDGTDLRTGEIVHVARYLDAHPDARCPECNGDGVIDDPNCRRHMHPAFDPPCTTECPACDGSGIKDGVAAR